MSKLAALLNMLASEFDGERANAARMIARMAAAEKKTVAEFVMSGGERIIYRDRIVEKTVYRDRPRDDIDDPDLSEFVRRAKSRARSNRKANEGGDLLEQLRWASQYREHLNDFECQFLDDILMRSLGEWDLTYKQEKVARRIIAKVKVGEEPLL